VEDGLRISEQRLRKLVDANIIGILYRSEDGRVLEANNAYLDITGCSRQELEEGLINTFEITPEEFHQLDNEAMYEARKKGSCQPYEKEYIHKDGKRIPVLIGFAQLDPSEQALVGFVLDLSQLKHTEAALQDYANRLEQSNKELEHFAYIASHDLQEPLRKIKMFGERVSIRIGEQIDDETKDFLDRMQDASRRMEMMIDDLLQLSRVNTRGCPFVLVDLMKVAQEVVSDLGYRIQESGGRVVVEELPDIHADPIQIHQLLQNLIGNALKFHKPGTAPQVKVYARTNGKAESPETVKLYVSDNGVGFNEEYAERIFQPFERLVGRSEYEGSGIGLAICKKIVERHGGTITARSKRGEGSTFSITLPCKNNESRKQRKI
ncbi:MAG: PAS domain S-box protein, partial [Chloroflexi bacterium]